MATIFVCPKCGSDQVQGTAWVWVNKQPEEVVGGDLPTDDRWCEACRQNIGHFDEREEPTVNNKLLKIAREMRDKIEAIRRGRQGRAHKGSTTGS